VAQGASRVEQGFGGWVGFSPAEWAAIGLSLKVATIGSLASLPLGIAMAWLFARRQFPGKLLLYGLVHLPLVLPPVVTGWLLLIAFGQRGIFGRALESCCGIVFSFRWTGAALAAAVMGFPLMVRTIRLSIEAVDARLEQAGESLGAPPLAVFFTITLPLALPGVIAGLILGFARAIGEFGATITFVANIPGETQTIATAIYGYTQEPGAETSVVRLTLVAIAIAFGALVASEFLAARVSARVAET
jgi:molybdate transport system permease protein